MKAHVKQRRIGRPCGRVEVLHDHGRSIAASAFVITVLPDRELGGPAAARRNLFRFTRLRTAPHAGPAIDGIRREQAGSGELAGIDGFDAGQAGRAATAGPGAAGGHVTLAAEGLPRPSAMSGSPGRTQSSPTDALQRAQHSGQATGSRLIH